MSHPIDCSACKIDGLHRGSEPKSTRAMSKAEYIVWLEVEHVDVDNDIYEYDGEPYKVASFATLEQANAFAAALYVGSIRIVIDGEEV